MNKKDILKLIVIILLVGCIGIEGFLFFRKQSSNETKEEIPQKEKIDLTPYLVDITKPYYLNGIKYKVKEDDGYFYQEISGLKDKKVQEKINKKIKDTTANVYKNLDDSYDLSETMVYTSITANYSNILSISIIVEEREPTLEAAEEHAEDFVYYPASTLNFDLTTGELFELDDVVSSIEYLKEQISYKAEEEITRKIGFEYNWMGMDYGIDPDYSTVEDSTLSVLNQFLKGNYTLVIENDSFNLTIKDTYIVTAITCIEERDDLKECEKITIDFDDDEPLEVYINNHYIEKEINLRIQFLDIMDYLAIYNRFETEESIYENERQEEPRVFLYSDTCYNNGTNTITSSDTTHIDYDLERYYCADTKPETQKIKDEVIKESSELQSKNYNIYIYDGRESILSPSFQSSKEYKYIAFNVYHYDLPKEQYEKVKKDLYIAKYNKYKFDYESMGGFFKESYDVIKPYQDKEAFYFYIYDKNGKEVTGNEMFNHDVLSECIPDSWLNTGKYKTKEDMIKELFVLIDNKHEFKNRLVVEVAEYRGRIKLIYQGKEVVVCDGLDECQNTANQIFK